MIDRGGPTSPRVLSIGLLHSCCPSTVQNRMRMTPTDDQIDYMSLEELLDLLPAFTGSLSSAIPLMTPTTPSENDSRNPTADDRIAEGGS